ncbi:hypothetical protein K523DRAFT_418665 [Schizophyllum commune Tattone D]|nr:hypothetical protein K523DRAFT_418665 [Schizophyllum commune Tattone D]
MLGFLEASVNHDEVLAQSKEDLIERATDLVDFASVNVKTGKHDKTANPESKRVVRDYLFVEYTPEADYMQRERKDKATKTNLRHAVQGDKLKVVQEYASTIKDYAKPPFGSGGGSAKDRKLSGKWKSAATEAKDQENLAKARKNGLAIAQAGSAQDEEAEKAKPADDEDVVDFPWRDLIAQSDIETLGGQASDYAARATAASATLATGNAEFLDRLPLGQNDAHKDLVKHGLLYATSLGNIRKFVTAVAVQKDIPIPGSAANPGRSQWPFKGAPTIPATVVSQRKAGDAQSLVLVADPELAAVATEVPDTTRTTDFARQSTQPPADEPQKIQVERLSRAPSGLGKATSKAPATNAQAPPAKASASTARETDVSQASGTSNAGSRAPVAKSRTYADALGSRTSASDSQSSASGSKPSAGVSRSATGNLAGGSRASGGPQAHPSALDNPPTRHQSLKKRGRDAEEIPAGKATKKYKLKH